MKDVVIIRSQKESEWVSCKSIVSNLEASYAKQRNIRVRDILYFDNYLNSYEIHLLAKKIIAIDAFEIIFIDHKPHPAPLIWAIHKLAPDYKVSLIFHVFGDFVLDSTAWYSMNGLLKNYPVHFFCASQKQKNLIDSLLISDDCSSVCPFPVDKSVFYFDQNERNQLRSELGLVESDFLFIYTGRASLQKNVLELTKSMHSCSKISGDNLHFYFAGPFDDLGIPYKGYQNPPGVYFQQWLKLLNNHPSSRICYINNLGASELRRYCNAADCFISISTHNDEDFGMSPAEAMMCGLPLILSDWGGYGSFKHINPEQCELIPINPERNLRILPDLSLVQKVIYKKSFEIASFDERTLISQNADKYLSIDSVSNYLSSKISQRMQSSFLGFNSRFAKLSSVFKSNPKRPFVDPVGNYSDYYFDIYAPYFQATKHD
jgi:glycosyltransferase involved in cell wall biosynthesis